MLLLTLRGTPVLYYGDEIGMAEAECRRSASSTRSGCCATPTARARRRADADAVDARAGRRLHRARRRAVAALRRPRLSTSPRSARTRAPVLHLVRDLIGLRRAMPDLAAGAYAQLDAPAGAGRSGAASRVTVALNLSARR